MGSEMCIRDSFNIASIFLGRGLIPLRVTQNPKYSSSDLPKKDLLALTFKTAF